MCTYYTILSREIIVKDPELLLKNLNALSLLLAEPSVHLWLLTIISYYKQ